MCRSKCCLLRGPAQGQVEGLAGAGIVGWVFRALVEGHGDIRAEGDLHIHGVLGREEMGRSVEVRAEFDPFLGDLTELVEAEDLESAGVGEDGVGPAHETVQASHAADEFVAGTQVKMIGVAEDDAGIELLE